MDFTEGDKTIEINSLSLQGTKPLEVLYPPEVTSKMLDNADKALQILEETYPSVKCGLNLHIGQVIALDMVKESGVSVSSVDIPDLSYPVEFVQKVKERPTQIISHVAWRLNSVLGFSSNSAQTNMDSKLEETKTLEPFNSRPFIRVSAKVDKNTGYPDEKLVTNIYERFEEEHSQIDSPIIAVEYNAEEMSVEKYIEFVKHLNKGKESIGFSMDLAHIYEYFKILQQRDSNDAKQATINLWENVLKENPKLIFSLDINNVLTQSSDFGETHKGILNPGGVIPTEDTIKMYRKSLETYKLPGRIAIEPSPWDSQLMLSNDGMAYLLSQVKPFVIHTTGY